MKHPRFSQLRISKILKQWSSTFFWKCSKLYIDSKKALKCSQKVFGLQDKCIWIACWKFPVLWREYVTSLDNGLTYSPKISHMSKSNIFQLYLMLEWRKRRIKVRFCRVLQCVGPVNTLTAEICSETRPAMHSNFHDFCSEYFRKYLSYEPQLFFENFQNITYILKIIKISTKSFWFLR